MDLDNLPQKRIENLPIPKDIEPDDSWPPSLVEMAEHIGPFAALQMADAFGGLDLYIPNRPKLNPARHVIGPLHTRVLSKIYKRELLPIPVAAEALRRARRRDTMRAVQARRISLTEAAYILRTSRRYVLQLLEKMETAS